MESLIALGMIILGIVLCFVYSELEGRGAYQKDWKCSQDEQKSRQTRAGYYAGSFKDSNV